MTWLLLLYTMPSQPPGKRAAVWRDLKKCGAVYLRDGVAALPEHEATRGAFRAIVARIDASGGQSTLASGAHLAPENEAAIIAQARAERAAEREEIVREAKGFLDHIDAERVHRALSASELEALVQDLGKLHRWAAQVRARDHFGAGKISAVDELLNRCEQALNVLIKDSRLEAAGVRP